MAPFETFTRRMVPLGRQPRMTIQKRGTISLNQAAFAALGAPAAVELLFDTTRHVVGLRAVPATCEHAYPVRSATGKESGPFIISAVAFVKFYGISSTTSMRWPAFLEEDVLCADLDGGGTPVSSNRARPAPPDDH